MRGFFICALICAPMFSIPTPSSREMAAWQHELDQRQARDLRRADERIARFRSLFLNKN